MAAYLVFVGVMFAWYARQGVGGTPPWWWVVVGATAVTAFSGFLAMAWSSQTGFNHASGRALILPQSDRQRSFRAPPSRP